MASRVVAFIAVQGILLQAVYSQCVNRVLPSLGPNVFETIIPNQVVYREPTVPILPAPCAGPVMPTPVYQNPIIPGPVITDGVYTPTVIQDSSVANSLANALQLLVVSNLLSTTLPGPCDVPYNAMGLPAYNYVY